MQSEVLASEYTLFTRSMFPRLDLHEHIVRNDLTRQLGKMTPVLMEELSRSFSQLWGTETEEWRNINVWKTLSEAIVTASHRMIAGGELCRNEEYITACTRFAIAVPAASVLIRLCPGLLRPVMAPLFTLPLRWYVRKIRRWIDPIVVERVARRNTNAGSVSPKMPENAEYFIHWLVDKAVSENMPDQLDLETVAHRVLIVHFFSVNTLSFATTNLLFDLFSWPSTENTIFQLRQESFQVLAEDSGAWTKAGLAKMYLMDSAIRESLRSNGFSAVGLGRQIIADEGLTLDNGVHIPKGVRIAVANYGLHHDSDIYPSPNEYDALRFARHRAELVSNNVNDVVRSIEKGSLDHQARNKIEKTTSVLAHRNLSMVSTSPTYMAFGHGRHACPGRFFAATTMKLILAYIVIHYDIERLDTRPENEGLAEGIIPPPKATLRVRRRARRKDSA